jgi:hypothetical protein
MTIDRSRDGNRSYWQETFDLTMPSAPLPTRASHVVVGGGIVGSAHCVFFRQKPDTTWY